MDDITLEEKLSKDYCSLRDGLQISESCNNRLNNLTKYAKHTKIKTRILTTQIIILLSFLFLIPTTAYATIKVSDALFEKVKDAGLSEEQIVQLDNKLREQGFSEEDIESFDDLHKNRNGQTYGPDFLEANLVAVISEEGYKGYVYREDLNPPNFNSPEEALKWQESKPEYTIIPVYKSDGKTVVGTFKMGGSSMNEDTN